jgi:GAF domain-containing protein
VEPGYLNDPSRFSTLRAALAVPLEGTGSVVAVLALYRARADAFSRDELEVLQAVGGRLGAVIEMAVLTSGASQTIKISSFGAHAGAD